MELPSHVKEQARGRQQYKHNDQVVYEWEQSLEDVIMYFQPPPPCLPKNQKALRAQLQPGQTLPTLDVQITRDTVAVGLKGNPPFLREQLGGQCITSESFWMIEDDELVITLQKMRKGETWSCACQGHGQLDPLTQSEQSKKILLERFQEEHPGFDFSQAEMNGMVPDAREFMGGISYK